MNGFHAALRLAWRDIRLAPGRSFLIVSMIALPVTVVTALLVIRGTARGTAEQMRADNRPLIPEFSPNSLVIAMIVLQTILLAGPAFAVGLRRRRRLLALASASGGDPGQLRTVVLGSGLLLGGIAGPTGLVLGFTSAWASRRLLARYGEVEFLPYAPTNIPWFWIAVVLATAVLSALAAAYAPARQAARTDAAAVLAGRGGPPQTRPGLPLLGALLIAAGLAVTVLALDELRESGPALGATLIIIGLVLATPAVIALTGRFAGRLPLPLRLAVRDADRNRMRTAPAVAAIMASTAAFTALAIGGSSDLAQERLEYQPRMDQGQAVIDLYLPEETQEQRMQETVESVQRVLPDHLVSRVDRPSYGFDTGASPMRLLCGDTRCRLSGETELGAYLIGGPESVRLLLGRDDPAVTAALAEGKAAVFVPGAVAGGEAVFAVREDEGEGPNERTLRLPAVQAEPAGRAPFMLMPYEAAERLDLSHRPSALLVDGPIDREQQKQLQEELPSGGSYFHVYVERGFAKSPLPLVLLGAAASVLVLGAALIATRLAAADARPELATLTAVGARPATKRLLLMAQTAYIAVLGCALGLLAGAGPGIAVAYPLTDGGETDGVPAHGVIIDVPWLFLLAVLVGVPLVASAVTALSVRGRQVLPERTAA